MLYLACRNKLHHFLNISNIGYGKLNLFQLEYDSDSESKGTGMGVGVSTMSADEDEIPDEEKSVFDWCKEGNLDQVKKFLADSKDDEVNKRDEEVQRVMGYLLLHICLNAVIGVVLNLLGSQ